MRFVTWVMVAMIAMYPGPTGLAGQAQDPDRPSPSRSGETIPVIPGGSERSHGHDPDTRTGTPPCEYGNAKCGSKEPAPAPHHEGHTGRNTAIGVGAGALAGLIIYKIASHRADHMKTLSERGPQFPELLHMSRFQVTGFVKGGWPVVVDYQAQKGGYSVLTIAPEGAGPLTAILPTQQSGRQLVRIQLPASIGTDLKIADFTIVSTVSQRDQRLLYFRLYGFGAGPRAVGSVAIDQLKFNPAVITAANSDTQFGFHAHTAFDRVRAEFMQLQFIDRCMENKQFDDKPINRRLQVDESIEDTWNAKKSHSGQIQFRVRGWMTKDAGGDWVSAFSRDLVLRQ